MYMSTYSHVILPALSFILSIDCKKSNGSRNCRSLNPSPMSRDILFIFCNTSSFILLMGAFIDITVNVRGTASSAIVLAF